MRPLTLPGGAIRRGLAHFRIRHPMLLDLSPNPPKDTDGRREDSGRVGEGATGEMAGLIGVDWRSANGLQSPQRAPMALCGSCDARDGERIRSRELSRTGVARVCREVGSVAGWQSGGEWNGSQPGHGASELGFPRPMLGKMQATQHEFNMEHVDDLEKWYNIDLLVQANLIRA